MKYNTKWISNGKRHHERLKIKARDIKSSRPGVAEEKTSWDILIGVWERKSKPQKDQESPEIILLQNFGKAIQATDGSSKMLGKFSLNFWKGHKKKHNWLKKKHGKVCANMRTKDRAGQVLGKFSLKFFEGLLKARVASKKSGASALLKWRREKLGLVLLISWGRKSTPRWLKKLKK